MDASLISILTNSSPVVAILITLIWLARLFLPKFLEQQEKVNQSLSNILEKQSLSIEKIAESIQSFEKSILVVESRLSEKIDKSKSEIIEAIKDEKLDKLRQSFTDEAEVKAKLKSVVNS